LFALIAKQMQIIDKTIDEKSKVDENQQKKYCIIIFRIIVIEIKNKVNARKTISKYANVVPFTILIDLL